MVDLAHPGQHLAVAEPDPQHALHLDHAAHAVHDPDQQRRLAAATRRHEVGDPHGAAHGLPLGHQHQRVALVVPGDLTAPGRRPLGGGGADPPLAVPLVAQQGGEAGVGVEPRQAEPVNVAAAVDQRRGLHVADQCVVLDEPAHGRLPCRPARGAVRGHGRSAGHRYSPFPRVPGARARRGGRRLHDVPALRILALTAARGVRGTGCARMGARRARAWGAGRFSN